MGEPDIIGSGEEITPSWLSQVLGAEVTAAEVEDFGDRAGLLSILYRVTPTYGPGSDGPTSVVIKVPTPDAHQRGVADMLGLYQREITFYTEHGGSTPFAHPGAHMARMAPDSTDFTLVMEDMGGHRMLDQVEGVGLADARIVVEHLARFHSQWWEHDDLEEMGQTFVPLTAPLYVQALPVIFDGSWGATKQIDGALLTPELEAFGDRWGSLVPFFMDALSRPATFLHGDLRGDNLFVDGDGQLIVVDFQIMGMGHGVYDLAYFTSQSMRPEERRGHDRELVQLYVDTLATGGVSLDVEEAMRTYRLAVAFCLTYPVTSYASYEAFGPRQHELMHTLLSRCLACIVDNDSLALLPD